MQNLLPAGLRGLMIAAMLAALMSSLSSVFNSCSTLITVDIYKKLHPRASERQLVFIGRANTAIIVALSIAWIPLIRFMNAEVYQYLQSVQASIGAPITAVFLCGVLWRGATARAALTTLIVGGVLGFGRFFLDVAHTAFGVDLGPLLNGVVQYSFLNFSVFVFAFCLALMIGVSKLGERPLLAQVEALTVSWSGARAVERQVTPAQQRLLTLASSSVALVILTLWFHFR